MHGAMAAGNAFAPGNALAPGNAFATANAVAPGDPLTPGNALAPGNALREAQVHEPPRRFGNSIRTNQILQKTKNVMKQPSRGRNLTLI